MARPSCQEIHKGYGKRSWVPFFTESRFVGSWVVAALQTERLVLIPPETVFIFFARSKFQGRAKPAFFTHVQLSLRQARTR